MASLATHLSFFFLVTLFASLQSHARDSQLFNKISTNDKASPTTLNNQQQAEPDFLPENEDGYGLYGHETGQQPPSTTTNPLNKESHKKPLNKYLPKNYNPVSYVTEPEDIDNTLTNKNEDDKYYYKDAQNYKQEQDMEEYKSYPNTNENYYNLGSSFNSEPHGVKETRFENGFQPQGMSDTRLLEHGKYFYDVRNERYNSNHPYERLKGLQARDVYRNRNYYHKSSDEEFNNEKYDADMGGYNENQDEFRIRNEETNAMP